MKKPGQLMIISNVNIFLNFYNYYNTIIILLINKILKNKSDLDVNY